MMNATLPRKTSIIAFAALGLAALLLLLTVRTASAAMTESDVSPDNGPTAGGTIITITGTGFPVATVQCPLPVTVTVGENTANLAAEVTPTEIKVFAPPSAAGTVDITIKNNCDAQPHETDTVTNAFTYIEAPEVIGVAPATGATGGGIVVTIFGNHFIDGATVKFGATAGTAVDWIDEHQIKATAPAGTGTVDVTVTNPDDQADTLDDAFTYGTGGGGGSGTIIAGSIPLNGGFGLIVFGGGTNAQLLTASGCPQATAVFYATNAAGGFVTYIPGTGIAAVNAAWNTLFANGIPAPSALIGKCV